MDVLYPLHNPFHTVERAIINNEGSNSNEIALVLENKTVIVIVHIHGWGTVGLISYVVIRGCLSFDNWQQRKTTEQQRDNQSNIGMFRFQFQDYSPGNASIIDVVTVMKL